MHEPKYAEGETFDLHVMKILFPLALERLRRSEGDVLDAFLKVAVVQRFSPFTQTRPAFFPL